MVSKRLNFVEKIAKQVNLISPKAHLEAGSESNNYYVESPEEGDCSSLWVWVEKLKSGKYVVRIKQMALEPWKEDYAGKLQKSFDPTEVKVTQRNYDSPRGSIIWNVLQLTCKELPWK